MNRILLFIFLIFPIITFYQNTKLDSLNKVLINAEEDTSKVKILLEIYKVYQEGKINEGKPFLDQALQISNDLGLEKFIADVKLTIGKYYNITGDFEESLKNLEDAKSIFEKLNHEENLSNTYNNIGATYESMGRYDEAMDNLIKSLSISESLNDSNSIARTLLNIGLIHSRQEEFEKSLEIYKKALEISLKYRDQEDIALLYNNMAIVNYYLEDYDNVRNYFEKAYKIYQNTGNLRRQLMALSNLAEVDKMIGQKEKALNSFFEILKLEKELGQKGEQVITYYAIAEIYLSRSELKNAEKYAKLGLNLAKEISAMGHSIEFYGLLSEIYKLRKEYKTSLEYMEQMYVVTDSVFNAEKAKQIQEIETKYETKKKEQQILNLENEKVIRELKIKKQKNFTIFLLTGFISIFIFLLALFSQNKKIRKANKLLAYQKRQITDSIEYASRIQTAILPPGDFISRVIPEHFILYKPRDIVSGDFYWITHKNNKIVVAAVDCTGHGVPGAFMSMLGFALLNEIVNKETELKANIILNQLRDEVKKSLHQTGKEDEAKDGMDIALCVIDPERLTLQYSGAYNPLYLIRNNELISLKADRMPIGIHIIEKESFTNHEINFQKGDIIYIFTDGYVDQFGGPKASKFRKTPFKEMLISIKDKEMDEQKKILDSEFEKWKGNRDQIDDVLVMGIKL
ncbi:MAG: hypothetical protein C0597_08870 [Marinilabiliales bacterium]|nr:MAG: hypothetical protein C0597_08870 [Marinilabiliales bacterium]